MIWTGAPLSNYLANIIRDFTLQLLPKERRTSSTHNSLNTTITLHTRIKMLNKRI